MTVRSNVSRATLYVPSGLEVPGDGLDSASRLGELLDRYPTAAGWERRDAEPIRRTDGWCAVPLQWEAEGRTERDRKRRFDSVAPPYRDIEVRHLRPVVGDSQCHLSPLMTWWGLLFGLSSLARYEPEAWQAGLRIDESDVAAHLEFALDEALDAVAELVVDALTRWQIPRSDG